MGQPLKVSLKAGNKIFDIGILRGVVSISIFGREQLLLQPERPEQPLHVLDLGLRKR